MKKFLLPLLLVIGGVLFFNVSDVYAMTELEVDKIIRHQGWDTDDYYKKDNESGLDGTNVDGYCIYEKGGKTYFVFKPSYSSPIILKDDGTNSYTFEGNTKYTFEINNESELGIDWWWSVEDVEYYLNNNCTQYTLPDGGAPKASKLTNMPVNSHTLGTTYFNTFDLKLSNSRFNYSLTEDANGYYLGNYTTLRDIRDAQLTVSGNGVIEIFNKENMGVVVMKQQDMKGSSPYWRFNSCNQCAFDLLIQNSGLIKDSKYQCTGLVSESNANWKAYCDALKSADACGSDISGGGVFVGATTSELDFFKDLTGNSTWSHISANTSLDGNDVELVETSIVKWGNKDIKDMTKQEVATMLKVFYNNDYFCILGIKDKDSKGEDAKANGPTGYKGAHVVLFAGCKANEVFFNDSSHGRITSYTNDTTLYPDDSTPVRWMTAIKVNGASTKKICGGGSAIITQKDKEVVESLGIPSSILEQKYENDELISSYCKLMETDLESILADVNRDNLTGDQLDSLNTWEDTIADSSKSGGVLYWIRVVTMWIGILLVVWAVLLYVGFWFDRANNFIDISVVTILTLGMLATSETDEEYTYGNKDSKGIKTINNKILLKICICSIIVGVLIISGLLYTIIAKLVFLVKGLISKGA